MDIEWGFEEVMSGQWGLQGKIEDAEAHPALQDSSGDGLTDYEEMVVWETDPLDEDTSGDGYADTVDPEPTTDSTVPASEFESVTLQELELFVEADPDEVDVEVKGILLDEGVFDPLSGAGESDIPEEELDLMTFEPNEVEAVEDGTRYTVPLQPDNQIVLGSAYEVRITDEHGNTARHILLPETGQGPVLVSSMIDPAGVDLDEQETLLDQISEELDGQSQVAAAPGLPGEVWRPVQRESVRHGIWPAVKQVIQTLVAALGAPLVKTVLAAGLVAVFAVAVAYAALPHTNLPELQEFPHPASVGTLSTSTIQDGRFAEVPPYVTLASGTVAGDTVEFPVGEAFIRDGFTRGYGLVVVAAATGVTVVELAKETTKERQEEVEEELGDREIDEPEKVESLREKLKRLYYRVSEALGLSLRVREVGDLWVLTIGEKHDEDDDEIDGECGVAEDEVNMFIQETEQTPTAGGLTTFHGVEYHMDLQFDCPHDSEQWVRTVGGMEDEDLDDLNTTQRGHIAETHAGPDFVEDRGLDVVYLDEPGEPGFDIVAYNANTDEYHIIEAKFRSESGSVSNSSTWLDRPEEKSPQMTNA